MTEQRLGSMKDDERLGRVARSNVDRNAPGFSLSIDHSHLQVRRLAGAGRRILTLPSIELPTQDTVDDGHWSPPFFLTTAATFLSARPLFHCERAYQS